MGNEFGLDNNSQSIKMNVLNEQNQIGQSVIGGTLTPTYISPLKATCLQPVNSERRQV